MHSLLGFMFCLNLYNEYFAISVIYHDIYSVIQGVPEKSTRQIVIDNFEHWTATTKIENDFESIKLTSKHF